MIDAFNRAAVSDPPHFISAILLRNAISLCVTCMCYRLVHENQLSFSGTFSLSRNLIFDDFIRPSLGSDFFVRCLFLSNECEQKRHHKEKKIKLDFKECYKQNEGFTTTRFTVASNNCTQICDNCYITHLLGYKPCVVFNLGFFNLSRLCIVGRTVASAQMSVCLAWTCV